jgi:hypothetical protein
MPPLMLTQRAPTCALANQKTKEEVAEVGEEKG